MKYWLCKVSGIALEGKIIQGTYDERIFLNLSHLRRRDDCVGVAQRRNGIERRRRHDRRERDWRRWRGRGRRRCARQIC